jgi:hypothetical protein
MPEESTPGITGLWQIFTVKNPLYFEITDISK